MDKSQAQNIFQLQTELIDMKVDMAISKAIDRVIDHIASLKSEMHDFRVDMNSRLSVLDNRVVAIETRLGMNSAKEKAWYDRGLDYLFKTAWAWSSVLMYFLMSHYHSMV